MSSSGEGTAGVDHDVAIVGGGPAGCSAALFTARYGLDTAVFDRGRASLRQCAYLENYLGFPGGIDVETFYDLMHDQVRAAGCEFVPDLVTAVDRREDGEGFVVRPQDGEPVTGRRVIAATRYDGEYLRGLDDEQAMFESHEHGGERHEHFARDYAGRDGRTPVAGLYVASPSVTADRQAIMAAGRGARVAHALIADRRRAEGLPDAVADHYDWVRQEANRDAEWGDRDTLREHFAARLPDEEWLDDDHNRELLGREVDRRLDEYVTDEEIERRTATGRESLAAHLADDSFLDAIEDRRLLAHVDDDAVLAAASDIQEGTASSGERD